MSQTQAAERRIERLCEKVGLYSQRCCVKGEQLVGESNDGTVVLLDGATNAWRVLFVEPRIVVERNVTAGLEDDRFIAVPGGSGRKLAMANRKITNAAQRVIRAIHRNLFFDFEGQSMELCVCLEGSSDQVSVDAVPGELPEANGLTRISKPLGDRGSDPWVGGRAILADVDHRHVARLCIDRRRGVPLGCLSSKSRLFRRGIKGCRCH